MTNKVYINGNIYAANDAKVSIFDRGYLFSDGVYELIPYFNSKPFLLEEHYSRLQKSLEMLEIENPYSKDKWLSSIETLLKSCQFENYYLYIQVTRGWPRNFDDNILREHAATKDYQTCISMFYSKINSLKNKKTLSTKAITMEDKRWMQCDIKSVSLLYNSYAKTIAHKKGAYEAILVRDGYVTEGCSSNVFVIKDWMAHRESKIFFIGFFPVCSKISTAQVGLVMFISVSLSSIMSIPAKSIFSLFNLAPTFSPISL